MRGRPGGPATWRQREVALILRFAAVGAVGFGVDTGGLLFCIHAFGLDPRVSRFPSFALAVAATFPLNRAWVFRGRTDPGLFRGFMLYLSVQGAGFGCNLAAYSILILWFPTPWYAPVLCLAAASGLAMVVNYLGSRAVVFRNRRA